MVFAQSDKIKNVDSLLKISKSADANEKIQIFTEIAWCLRAKDLDSAIKLAHFYEKKITDETPKKIVGYNHHIIGSLYSLAGNYEDSEIWLVKAYKCRKKYEKDKSQVLATLINLFYTFQGLGNVKAMHKYITEAEAMMAESGNEGSGFHIITLLQMGEMYNQLKRPEKAEETFLKAIDVAENINKTDYYLSMAYTNYGTYLNNAGNFEKAITYFKKSREHNLKLLPHQQDRSFEVNMAIAYAETGKSEEAEKLFKSIYDEYKNGNNPYDRSTSSNNLAYFYYMSGRTDAAIPLFFESVEAAKEAGAANLEADRYRMISECYEVKMDFKKALSFRKLYEVKQDSLLNVETLKQLNSLTERYDNEKKEKKLIEYKKVVAESRLREQEKENELAVEKEQGERNKVIFGSAILVVLIIAGFIFYSYREKKKAHIALEEKNKKIESQHLMLEEKHKEITDSINYAKRIQTALLTSDEFWKQISDDYFVYFRPKDVVSGDFFWAYQAETKNGPLAIWCAADCTGHGVPGAFMSMLGISFLNEIVVEQGETDAARILNKLRIKIIKALEQKTGDIQQRDGMDIALCVWNKKSGILEFSGANNPLWLIRKNKAGEVELVEIKPDKMPVGAYGEQLNDFTVQRINLEKNDMIYTFSDGYSDQFGGEKGKKFKESNFKKLLIEISALPGNGQKEKIHRNFDNWKGQLEQIDDVCVIGVRV